MPTKKDKDAVTQAVVAVLKENSKVISLTPSERRSIAEVASRTLQRNPTAIETATGRKSLAEKITEDLLSNGTTKEIMFNKLLKNDPTGIGQRARNLVDGAMSWLKSEKATRLVEEGKRLALKKKTEQAVTTLLEIADRKEVTKALLPFTKKKSAADDLIDRSQFNRAQVMASKDVGDAYESGWQSIPGPARDPNALT